MAKSLPSFAEPKMLEWCRRTAGFTTATAAAALRREESEIISWEKGSGGPTFAQLREIAKLYHRPVAVFYLPEPPEDFSVMRDFRQLPANRTRDYSSKLRFLIRDSRMRQMWSSETLQEADADPHDFVGSITPKDGPEVIGQKLRHLLGVRIDDQRSLKDNRTAFTFWRERCEAAGVFVFTAREIDVSEMRGFAMPDKYAPSIVVNSKDSAAAKCFTLLHEMVHILLGVDGVSNRSITTQPSTYEQRIEVLCNAAAAEALVPANELTAFHDQFSGDLESFVVAASLEFRVSEEVISRRAYDIGWADREFYKMKRREYGNWVAPNKPKRKQTGSQPAEQRVISMFGKPFARLAVSAFYGGEASGPEVADLLNVKLHHLPKIEKELFPFRLQSLPRATP